MRSTTTFDVHTGPVEVSVGSELGSYRLVSLLGEGAMGRVFKARHVKLGRSVAIKVLNPEYAARPDVVKRFFREARVVNDIAHEHIVEVTDLVELPGLAFLVMELLDGESLRQILRRRKGKWPPVRLVVSVMAQVCDALEAAHDKGVVHRDLKPDNVFVIERGGRDYAKVLDFGIAKLKDAPDEGSTVTGMILGTPLYMSPEQAMGKEIGPATDVWSAGVVLYELLSGSVPFKAGNFVDLAQQIRTEPAPPLPLRTPRRERIPPALAAAVTKCLEKTPSDRFKSMGALAEALRSRSGVKTGRSGAWWQALVAAGLLAAGGWAAWRAVPPRRLAPLWGRFRTEVADAARSVSPGSAPAGGASAAAERHQPASSQPVRESQPRESPAPPRAARPSRPATVEWDLRSTPSGARVVRLDTGEPLGRTPLRVKVARRAGEVSLRFTLEGHEPATASASLRAGGKVSVALKKPGRKRRASARAGR